MNCKVIIIFKVLLLNISNERDGKRFKSELNMKVRKTKSIYLSKFMMKKRLAVHCLLLSLNKENCNLYPNPLKFITGPHKDWHNTYPKCISRCCYSLLQYGKLRVLVWWYQFRELPHLFTPLWHGGPQDTKNLVSIMSFPFCILTLFTSKSPLSSTKSIGVDCTDSISFLLVASNNQRVTP